MKNLFKFVSSCFAVGLFIMIALGCATQKYNVSLSSVESPADAKVQFGETNVVSFLDGSINKYTYEDDYIKITWYVDNRQFNFTLRNKSNHTIKINWDDISYVDYNGQTGRVMHSGVKYIEKNNSQPSSMVPKGASLSDILLPTENVYWSSSNWIVKPLISQNMKTNAEAYIGHTMTILMPIYIENVQNDYIFTFNIDSYVQPK